MTGVLTLDLFLPATHSLKAKRSLIKPFLAELRRRWNVAAAETAEHDIWQRARVAVVTVAVDEGSVRTVLDSVRRHAEEMHGFHVLDSSIEIH